uniref:Uncharacterized protein n=1 Tax=Rangifer tarandus platyrhynchus TaxID=3082113 RepID=A0ACB0F4I7_RANTA|nr:unnamed protein product [Rangifer tarandus platyrhynchus]
MGSVLAARQVRKERPQPAVGRPATPASRGHHVACSHRLRHRAELRAALTPELLTLPFRVDPAPVLDKQTRPLRALQTGDEPGPAGRGQQGAAALQSTGLSCKAAAQPATTQASGPTVKMDGANSLAECVPESKAPSASCDWQGTCDWESPGAQSSDAGRAERGDARAGGGQMLSGSGGTGMLGHHLRRLLLPKRPAVSSLEVGQGGANTSLAETGCRD